jgi:hypothetical protein
VGLQVAIQVAIRAAKAVRSAIIAAKKATSEETVLSLKLKKNPRILRIPKALIRARL